MGCCSSKRQEKEKPKAGFSPRDTTVAQKQVVHPPAEPAGQPAAKKKPPPKLELPRNSVPKRDPKTYKSPHVTITTVYEERDLIKLEMTPRGTIKKTVHFCCPVCLNYYNAILASTCCKNYLCHQCAKDLLDRDLQGAKGVACPSCQQEPLVLNDVDPGASVKLYTDTFAITRKDVPRNHQEDEDSDGLEVRDSPRGSDEPDNRI